MELLRRGCNFERLVSDAISREKWSDGQWRTYQASQLTDLLLHARNTVPYYKQYWDSQDKTGNLETIQDLKNWPILEKHTVRANPELFLSETSNKRGLQEWHTSGSSGTPTKIVWSKQTMRNRWAIFEARTRRWYGVSHKDNFALIGGRMVTPFDQEKPPFWVWNAASHQLYMSSYHLSSDNIPAYISEMKRRNIRHIYAYTSSIYEIARFMLDSGIKLPGLKVIVTQAEPLYAHQREAIEKAFKCPVMESYGMAEMLAQAGECEAGRMHLWPELGICEVDSGLGIPMEYGTGDLIATGLLNWDMPLIRYRVGDVVSISHNPSNCPCGRHMPALDEIQGRVDDVLITKDGRKIGRLSTVFKNLPLIEVQTIQKSIDHVLLKVVPGPEFTESSKHDLILSFQERMGKINIEVELVNSIPKGANGKFRAVVSEMHRI